MSNGKHLSASGVRSCGVCVCGGAAMSEEQFEAVCKSSYESVYLGPDWEGADPDDKEGHRNLVAAVVDSLGIEGEA